MKQGDKIIWDSGFGYELGYFLKYNEEHILNYSECYMITGIAHGKCSYLKQEVCLYTLNNIKLMIAKYIVDKAFDSKTLYFYKCDNCGEDGIDHIDKSDRIVICPDCEYVNDIV